MNDKLTYQSKREFAHSGFIAQQCYPHASSFAKVETVAALSSFCAAANSLYRYPSPDRPAYSPSRPITEIRLRRAKITDDIGYHGEIAIHRGADRTNCGAAEITMIGLRLCKRHQSSLRQWQYLVWQVASTMTWSAALLVQALASWLQKCWAQLAQVQCLLVQPSVCFATTLASTLVTKTDNRALTGRAMNRGRRRGDTPAAAFSFWGT